MIKKNGKEKQSKQLISLKLIKKNLSNCIPTLYCHPIIQSRGKIISHQAVTIHWSTLKFHQLILQIIHFAIILILRITKEYSKYS
jgi:hypothetical protein